MYELCLSLGIDSIGGNTYREIKDIALENDIDLVFTGEKKVKRTNNAPINIADITKTNTNINSSKLKKKLIDSGLKNEICECCGLTEWNGKPIPLQLHHINGDRTDNRIENLQILCPNCHAQTDNYCGKNTKNKKHLRLTGFKNSSNEYIIDEKYLVSLVFEHGTEYAASEFDVSVDRIRYWCKIYNIPIDKEGKKRYANEHSDIIGICPVCGRYFYKRWRKEQHFCSDRCAKNSKSKCDITKDELIKDFKEFGNFEIIGRKYGVTGKCISKWFKKFGLPYIKKQLNEYIKNIEP